MSSFGFGCTSTLSSGTPFSVSLLSFCECVVVVVAAGGGCGV
jgi:hypothetical protein